MKLIEIVFKHHPEAPPPGLEFVEVEDGEGNSINIGEWVDRDGFARLRIRAEEVAAVGVPAEPTEEGFRDIPGFRTINIADIDRGGAIAEPPDYGAPLRYATNPPTVHECRQAVKKAMSQTTEGRGLGTLETCIRLSVVAAARGDLAAALTTELAATRKALEACRELVGKMSATDDVKAIDGLWARADAALTGVGL